MIFHLLVRQDLHAASANAPVAVPGEDGYVHCCDEGQIAGVRRRWFAADAEVVALAFDPTRLPAETRYEPGALGEPERFPHVYGALPRDQVASVREA
ncbi:MAG TPA: DUF952 domain-containing protein [Gaiellales bacterium]|nr:DUF952 domain-containing protein [Gaiellales bacterium]